MTQTRTLLIDLDVEDRYQGHPVYTMDGDRVRSTGPAMADAYERIRAVADEWWVSEQIRCEEIVWEAPSRMGRWTVEETSITEEIEWDGRLIPHTTHTYDASQTRRV